MSTDRASRIWATLQDLVASEDRVRAVRAALDLGPGKVETLLRLAEGPMSLREIAQAVGVDPPAATVGVDQLEARGLVRRTPHPDDNRRKLVHLTDAGHEAVQRARTILNTPPAALANLNPDDLATLDALVARLLEHHP